MSCQNETSCTHDKPRQPASAYFMTDEATRTVRATLSILVDNEVGALARVVGLFAGRGYNIESLTVGETDHQKHTSRMALVKVAGSGEQRAEMLRLSNVFRAHVIDITHTSFTFELTGSPTKIDAFVDLMIPLGLVEMSRTGVVAIGRGDEAT